MSKPALPRGLYVITNADYLATGLLANAVQHAIVGGAKMVQYRDKTRDLGRRKHEAASLRDICREHGVIFIVNDDVRLADDVAADGVHLGRDDRPVAHARATLGPDAIIGASCYNSLVLARRACADGADYVTFGSFYPNRTQGDTQRAHREVLTQAADELDTHIVAIGGVTHDNGLQLINAGADMLAVCRGVFENRDPESAARHFQVLFRT